MARESGCWLGEEAFREYRHIVALAAMAGWLWEADGQAEAARSWKNHVLGLWLRQEPPSVLTSTPTIPGSTQEIARQLLPPAMSARCSLLGESLTSYSL